ncbi:LLM class flavin-dependent oxidoreductase, partial [Klebsiella pneumoniae]|nr:LLM class flavin-dependent oxidoreductase [Klebsiella pneumoniae]
MTCAETDEEAQAEYRRVIVEHGDWDAAKLTISKLMPNSQTIDYESADIKTLMEGVIRAFFAHPLTGSPDTVVAQIKEMADAGLEGMAI